MPARNAQTENRQAASLPLKVFVVEDSALVRQRLVEWFGVPGVIEFVGFSETEQAAVEALRKTPVDVVILDIQLREGNGIGVLEALRKRLPAPGTTFIVLTNFSALHFHTRCIKSGADHFLDKALDIGRLRQVLDELVRERSEE